MDDPLSCPCVLQQEPVAPCGLECWHFNTVKKSKVIRRCAHCGQSDDIPPMQPADELAAQRDLIQPILDMARRSGNDLCYITTTHLKAIDAALAQARVDREELIAAKERIAKLEARLEITHCFVMRPESECTGDVDNDLVRRELPPEERDSFPDAVECRDVTIALHVEEEKRLHKEIKRLSSTNGYEVAAEWRDKFKKAEAEVERLDKARQDNEDQLVRIANFIGKDARHGPISDRSIAGLVIAELTAARAEAGELAGALVAVREHVYCQNDYTTRDYDKYHAAVEQMNQALASYRAAHPEPEVTK